MLILEKRVQCQMKNFVGKMIEPVEERYQECTHCEGYDSKKYCYVKPVQHNRPLNA